MVDMKVGDFIIQKRETTVILGRILKIKGDRLDIRVLKTNYNNWMDIIVNFGVDYTEEFYKTITNEEAMLELL